MILGPLAVAVTMTASAATAAQGNPSLPPEGASPEGSATTTSPVHQHYDREEPSEDAPALPPNSTAPPPAPRQPQPAPPAASPHAARPTAAPRLIPPPPREPLPQYFTSSSSSSSSSTRPAQPSVQVESPDSAAAAMKRLNGGQASPTNATEELIRRGRGNVSFYELVDEMLDEIAYQLSKQDAALLSPLAIRLVRLSPDLRPEFAGTLEARLLARIAQATTIRTAVCVECTSMRSRVENGQWLVTLGAVRQEDLQRIGRGQGIKTFVDLGFTFNPQSNVIWMEAVAFRASDGGVVWSDAYRSDATTAMLLRTGRRIPSRSDRLEELEHKLQGRPFYGYMVALGLARLGYNGPTGDIMGPLMTIRIHERFGPDQQQLFGLSCGIFFTGVPQAGKNVLNSLLGGAYYSANLSEPSLNRPELWIYGELGGMFSGNQANTFYVESGLDLHLKWRFSMVGGLQYLLPTTFADHDIGGPGYRIRLAFNW
jgi:hypothetical protein